MISGTSGQDTILTPKNKTKKQLAIIASIILAILIALWFFIPVLKRIYSAEMMISKERLQFATVTRGNLQRDIAVQGKVVAAVSPSIYAPSAGTVDLHVKAGDKVSQDQILAQVESPELRSRQAQENARLEELRLEVGRQEIQTKTQLLDNKQKVEIASVDLEAAKRERDIAEMSLKKNITSKQQYDRDIVKHKKAILVHAHAIENAKLHKESLTFELKAKKLQLERQQFIASDLTRQVEELNLRSPVDGVIGSVNIRQKNAVNKNQQLITVVDLRAFEVEVNIPENYADDLGIGLKTEISFNNNTYKGELTAISPEVTNGQVVGRIRFAEATPSGLRQHQRITARILIESREDILKVKRGSFVESGGSRLAYVVNEKTAKRSNIRIGARSIHEIEIISGLHEGDTIIISSLDEFNGKEQLYITD